MEISEKHLGKILVEMGLVTPQQLEDALVEQRRTKEFLGSIFLRKRQLKERDLLEALSKKFKIPVASIKDRYIDWEFVKQFNSSLIFEHKCLPLQGDDVSITLAIINPLDVWMLKKAEEESGGLKLKFVLVPAREMEEALERYRKYL